VSRVDPEARQQARAFAAWVGADPDWERLGPPARGRVAFRLRPRGWAADDPRLDTLNERLREAVGATGEAGLARAVVAGRRGLVLDVGRLRGGADRVERAWAMLRAEALRLGATPPVVA
jgi:glutamate/tyrosine decarboxylase-like PLP-dependent enzyme